MKSFSLFIGFLVLTTGVLFAQVPAPDSMVQRIDELEHHVVVLQEMAEFHGRQIHLLEQKQLSDHQTAILLIVLLSGCLFLLFLTTLVLLMVFRKYHKLALQKMGKSQADTTNQIRLLEDTVAACEVAQSALNERFQTLISRLSKDIARFMDEQGNQPPLR